MNSVQHDLHERSSATPAPLARVLEDMLGVSGDDDPIHRVLCELEELTRVVAAALVEADHPEASLAFMAQNRARAAVALYERRGLIRGGVVALEEMKRGPYDARDSIGAQNDAAAEE